MVAGIWVPIAFVGGWIWCLWLFWLNGIFEKPKR